VRGVRPSDREDVPVQPDPSPDHADTPPMDDESDPLAGLDGIADLPLAEQVEAYQVLHRALQHTLGEIDTA
jgi:hypothetical protein